MKKTQPYDYISRINKYRNLTKKAFEEDYQKSINNGSTLVFSLTKQQYPFFYEVNNNDGLRLNDLLAKESELLFLYNSLDENSRSQYLKLLYLDELLSCLEFNPAKSNVEAAFKAVHSFDYSLYKDKGEVDLFISVSSGLRYPLYDQKYMESIFRFVSLKLRNNDSDSAKYSKLLDENIDIENKSLYSVIENICKDGSHNKYLKAALLSFFLTFINHKDYSKTNFETIFLSSYFFDLGNPILGNLGYKILNNESDLQDVFFEVFDYRNRNDLTPYVRTWIVKASNILSNAIFSLRRYINEHNRLTKQITKISNDSIVLYLTGCLGFNSIGVSAENIAKDLGLSVRTTLRRLLELKKKNLVVPTRLGKTVYYSLAVAE